MGSFLSVYLKKKILSHIWGLTVYPPPTIYVGLEFSILGVDVEHLGINGYERVKVDNWNTVVNGEVSNTDPIVFVEATADWVSVTTFFSLWDALTGGNELALGSLTFPISVLEGLSPRFLAGKLKATLGETYDAFSSYTEDKMMKHIFGESDFSPPSNLYIGLLTAFPGNDGTNENCNEVLWSNASYLRVMTSPSDWKLGTDPETADLWNQVTFEFPKALESWGEVTHFGLFDVSSPTVEGNLLMIGPIIPTVNVKVDSELRFAAADLGPPKTVGLDFAFLEDLP